VPVIHQTVPKLRSSQVSTAVPSLSTDGARSQSRDLLIAFPAPILLGFSQTDWTSAGFGTMRPSDSLNVICRPRCLGLSGILVRARLVCHVTNKNDRVSLVALMTSCIARADERLRVFSHSLP
jgi:hypothetical protein